MARSSETHHKHVVFSDGATNGSPVIWSNAMRSQQENQLVEKKSNGNRDKYRPGLFGRVEHLEWYEDKVEVENKNENNREKEEDIDSQARDFIKRTHLKYDFRRLDTLRAT